MNDNEVTREWLEARGMILTEVEDQQVRRWLEENDARMIATVDRGFYSVLIYRAGSHFSGAAESRESLGEAVRHAQLAFDARVILALKRAAKIVGQA